MDYQTYRTRAEAQVEIAKMRGWDAKPVHILSTEPDADGQGQHDKWVWVIQCDGDKYLRDDGFVR